MPVALSSPHTGTTGDSMNQGRILLTSLILASSFVAFSAAAAESVEVEANATFLSDTAVGLSDRSTFGLPGEDAHYVAIKRQQLQDLNRGYEMRERYGLISKEEQAAHFAQMESFSKDMVWDVGNHHIRDVRTKAERNASPELRAVARHMALVAGAYAFLYRGEALRFRLGDSAEMSARTSVQSRSGQVGLASEAINGYVAVAAAGDAHHDQLRAGVSRTIPVLDISSGLSYGANTQTMTASVSKQLSHHLTGVVDSSRSAIVDQANEDSVKLLFGVRF